MAPVLGLVIACGTADEGPRPAPPPAAAQALAREPAPPGLAAAPPASAAVASARYVAAKAVAAKAVAPAPGAGEDLVDPSRVLFRVAACGGTAPVPQRFARAAVDRHCERMNEIYDRYRQRWLALARPFIADLRPPGLPKRVVYPFGGGDLLTALAVFPDAEEITTISLEPAGDVRHIESIPPERLPGALAVNGHNLRRLLGISYSNTLNLGRGGRASLPGELVMLLGALAVHGFEPTGLRYFRFAPSGQVSYLSAPEILSEGSRDDAAPEGALAPFANVELRFRAPGGTGPERVVRHVAQDLSNTELSRQAGLLAYLDALGPVSVMTKAASHLLWADDFFMIRNYVLRHAEWMISDSTGVPPRYAEANGFVQDTYGAFHGPARFGPIEPLDSGAFRRLFADQPARPLPFKFGYGDVGHRSHLIVMRRP